MQHFALKSLQSWFSSKLVTEETHVHFLYNFENSLGFFFSQYVRWDLLSYLYLVSASARVKQEERGALCVPLPGSTS